MLLKLPKHGSCQQANCGESRALVIVAWLVPVLDEPLEYLVPEEFELADTGSSMGGITP